MQQDQIPTQAKLQSLFDGSKIHAEVQTDDDRVVPILTRNMIRVRQHRGELLISDLGDTWRVAYFNGKGLTHNPLHGSTLAAYFGKRNGEVKSAYHANVWEDGRPLYHDIPIYGYGRDEIVADLRAHIDSAYDH